MLAKYKAPKAAFQFCSAIAGPEKAAPKPLKP